MFKNIVFNITQDLLMFVIYVGCVMFIYVRPNIKITWARLESGSPDYMSGALNL